MSDDPGDLFPPTTHAVDVNAAGVVSALETLEAGMMAAFKAWRLPDPRTATPEQRVAIVGVRAALDAISSGAADVRSAIDLAFKRAYGEDGIRQYLLPDGRKIAVEKGQGTWHIDEDALWSVLAGLVTDRVISEEERDRAMHREVVVKVDHRILNALAGSRGTAVAEAIDACRSFTPAPYQAARVTYPGGL